MTRVLLSKRGRLYRQEASALIKKQYRLYKVIDYKVRVILYLYPPTLRKYDIDNFNKAILDVLTYANVWLDDELVYELHSFKRDKHNGGSVVVSIEKL